VSVARPATELTLMSAAMGTSSQQAEIAETDQDVIEFINDYFSSRPQGYALFLGWMAKLNPTTLRDRWSSVIVEPDTIRLRDLASADSANAELQGVYAGELFLWAGQNDCEEAGSAVTKPARFAATQVLSRLETTGLHLLCVNAKAAMNRATNDVFRLGFCPSLVVIEGSAADRSGTPLREIMKNLLGYQCLLRCGDFEGWALS
jgi:hypothetical protein